MAPGKGLLIARSDFPMYLIKALDERHFLVAGGGGQAKTGVANAIEIYETKVVDGRIVTSSICRHDTGSKAAMNGAIFYDGRNHNLAVGLDDECHILSVKYKIVSPSDSHEGDDSSGLRKRKGGEDKENSTDKKTNSQIKSVTFDIEKIKSVKTDFAKSSSFQKVVQFSPDRSVIATGGADGYLRVWKFDDLKKLYEVQAHKNDIDDLDFSPAGNRIVTVSRDNKCCVWNTKDGSKFTEVKWPDQKNEYRFRACRYGLIEGNKEKFNMYTINIPCKRLTKPVPCFLTMWDSSNFKVKKILNTGAEVLCSLAVSKDGVYIAVGTISGSVAVFISFSLQKLYSLREAHSIFVTGLEFLPVSEGAQAVTGNQDFTLISISADNTIRIHQEPVRSSYSILWVMFGLLFLVCLLFYFMAEMGM
ncbi:hypothetical protein ACJMK2_042741 [Sinanodonta woodiana]|uniref:Prolactin regulatory element-binding protein n=1 Tax=Sinanodonta woodiana TaxID=1069815 RepID=A0ABD3WC49_SINWO